MRHALSRAFLRVPERDPFAAKFFAGLGCVLVVLGVAFLLLPGSGGFSDATLLLFGLFQFVLAAFYNLPAHRRRAKLWLKVVMLSYGPALLLLYVVLTGAR